ncbi:MAG: putative bifunctional diguanylate cyclase/phosphodiesterase [Geminicoccales bacterium]
MSRQYAERWRETGRLVLGALLVIGGILAWHMSATLQDQAQDLNRYVRVDIWAAQQAEYELQRLLLVLAKRSSEETSPSTAIRQQQQRAANALKQLRNAHDRDGLASTLDIETVVRNLEDDLTKIKQAGSQPEQWARLSDIEQSLTQGLSKLHQVMIDLTHLKLQLQDRDLAQIKTLGDLNRSMVVGFYIIAAIFTCFLWWEADGARQASHEASASGARFRDIAEIASDWVWETDSELRFAYISEKIEQTISVKVSDHLTKPISSLFAEQTDDNGHSRLSELTAHRQPFRDITCHVATIEENETRIIRLSGKPFFDAKGVFLGYRGVGTDISIVMRREERIRYLAEHDQLTGLPNRTVFQDHLRTILHSDREGDRRGSLLALDLDGFKDVNDTFGHDVGDALILAVADRLSGLIRDIDLVARLGGDEFAIVWRCHNADDGELADLSDRLLTAFKSPFRVAGNQLSVGVSIGIARFPEDGVTVEDLMKAGDLALYGAKERGRGCVVHFDREMTLQLQRRRTIEGALKRAIEQGDLTIAFQPQIDLSTHRLVGAEALVRWHDRDLGAIPPDVFIDIAEASGLILPLGQWVLETSCREATSWGPLGIDGVVAVNISTAQLTQQNLVKAVEDVLGRTGLPANRLELEITESLLMGDTSSAISTLDHLRELGVQLAIDDFGTGYSSLSYLKRFNVHKVKIDKSFVTDLERDDDDRRIVNAIVMLGRALNLKTIAEGVETEGQSRLLTSLGCNEAQGYLFGRPMPADQFINYGQGVINDGFQTKKLAS